MPDRGFVSIEDRIERLEDKIDQVSDMIVRMAEDFESGLADVQKTSDEAFKQLKQAILFWGARSRAIDDREGVRRRGTL